MGLATVGAMKHGHGDSSEVAATWFARNLGSPMIEGGVAAMMFRALPQPRDCRNISSTFDLKPIQA